jgi:tripartite-type tricarboxylate transporter receptor subunit TctC
MFKTITRRAAVGLLVAGSLSAQAAGFPEKPIKLVIPFPPGGLVGAVSLAIATKMGPVLGQPVVLENRLGHAGHRQVHVQGTAL